MTSKKIPVFRPRSRFSWNRRSGIIFFLVCVAFFGCKGFGPIRGIGYDLSNRYKKELNNWTRQAEIYNNFDLVLSLAATYQSEAFRAAYVEEYVTVYGLKEVAREKKLSDHLEAAASTYEFLFAVHVQSNHWDDFQMKGSIWKIFLELNNAKRLNPLEIIKLKKTDAVINHFYPYVTPWKSIYRVRFSKSLMKDPAKSGQTLPDKIKLVITGVPGRAELRWKVAELKKG